MSNDGGSVRKIVLAVAAVLAVMAMFGLTFLAITINVLADDCHAKCPYHRNHHCVGCRNGKHWCDYGGGHGFKR